MIVFLTHFTDPSHAPSFLFPSNLFQRVAATGPNVSHLTRLAENLACQYVSSLIHQLTLFIAAVFLLSHFTTKRLDFALSLRSSISPPGPLLQGVKAMTITVLARPKCNEGNRGRGWG